MWQPIVGVAHFVAELVLGILVVLGFLCWLWFIAGVINYKKYKDLPEDEVEAEELEGLKWWNAWRWIGADAYRPLQDNVIIESSIFGVASVLALIWVLDMIFV